MYQYKKMKTGLIILTVFHIVCFLCASGGFAQEEAYRIGATDVLSIEIYAGGESQQAVQATVSEQGMISVPFIGGIRAAGLTLPELQEQIIAPLSRDYFVNPEVIIHIKEYHSLHYYIAGAVNTPGLYETTSRATLMTLIAKAGGVLPNRGSTAYILRDSARKITNGENLEELISRNAPHRINLKRLLDQGDMSENTLLETGDVVYIPLEKEQDVAESNIYVEGEVKKPGVYSYQPGLSALNACLMAGGFGKYAAPNRTRIVRKQGKKQLVININLEKVRDGKIPDIDLMPGDLINVPESWL